MKNKYINLIAGAVILITAGCRTPATPFLSVPENPWVFAVTDERKTFEVTSNVHWTISGQHKYDWVKNITPVSGKGVDEVTVTLEPNTTPVVRDAELTITATGVPAVTVGIRQAAATKVNSAEIAGVTKPEAGATPVTGVTETAQYTGGVTWNPAHTTFAANEDYTATITLAPKAGFTFTGVTENFFKVAGATTSNEANSGIITAIFPTTGTLSITIAEIGGVTAPATDETPVTAITETAQYTGSVTWEPPVNEVFAGEQVYTATITLDPKEGFSLEGVTANFFTVQGATPAATNAAGIGVITAKFPATEPAKINIAEIPDVKAPVRGETPVSSFATEQYTGTVAWSPTVPAGGRFAGGQIYTATITLKAMTGFTLAGVAANFFTVAGMSTTHANGVIAVTFTETSTIPVPVISTTAGALAAGTVDVAYSAALSASNDPTVWTVASGALPGGLTLNNSGVIAGTPTTAGTFNFSITASNAGGASAAVAFSIVIHPKAPVITTPAGALTAGTVDVAYSAALNASNDPTGWTVATGALPGGLTLNNSGVIAGTPTTAGTFNFSVNASNATGASAAVAFSILINLPAPAITTTAGALTAGTTGVAYSVTLSATNAPTDWAVASGALPDGLLLNNSGVIAGTPTAAGTFSFSITASNVSGASAAVAFSIEIKPPAPAITTTAGALTAGTVDVAYSATLTATNAPTGWTVASGALPGGLTLNSSGVISGTPTTEGTFDFSVIAFNSGDASAAVAFSILIHPAAPAITTAAGALAEGSVDAAYSVTLSATNAPTSWAVASGALPDGLLLNNSGRISGTPTTAGTFNFSVTASNAGGASAEVAFSIVIKLPLPVITTAAEAFTDGTVGIGYSVTLTATNSPTIWTVASDKLPDGLTLDNSGVVSGIPTKDGTFNFSITASNASGASSPRAFSIKIIAEPGSAGNPFIVNSVATLQKVGTNTDGWTLSSHYRQIVSLNLSGVTWTPIGTSSTPFIGSYDGGGFSIHYLTISTGVSNAGLFGRIGMNGAVRNVALRNVNIVSTSSTVGGITGNNNYGTIENCYVTGYLEGRGTVGGVAGSGGGSIENCYTTCTIICGDNTYAGGIAGLQGSWDIRNCYATGNISGRYNVGGIVGYIDGGAVQCVALNQTVTGTDTPVWRVMGGGGIPESRENYARTMTITINGEPVDQSPNPAGRNGETITSAEWLSSEWWRVTAGYNPAYWDLDNGRLPWLRTTEGGAFSDPQ